MQRSVAIPLNLCELPACRLSHWIVMLCLSLSFEWI